MEDLSDVIFTVLRPGKMDRLFTGTRAAVEFLIDHPGEAHLHGPNGLIMSKGVIGARGGMRELASDGSTEGRIHFSDALRDGRSDPCPASVR